METITSLQNQRVKNVLLLQEKSRERKQQNLFVVEGAREIGLALDGGYTIDTLFTCNELCARLPKLELLESKATHCYDVSKAVFAKMAYREGSDGLMALVVPKPATLDTITLSANPFVIVLEAVEKPGNLGAILRTADAAQVDAVIVCDPLSDLYNPNVIRSSLGCLFTQQVAVATAEECLGWLKKNNIIAYAAELTASQHYCTADFCKPSAIVMGTEADGLTGFWIANADARIKIPMRGKIDSLNVSVSTAVITFEAMRQRGF